MGLGPGSSIQVHIEVNPVTVGSPQQANLTVNRLPPAHRASIESRQGLLLLTEGLVGALREATVSATVSEMDEGGNTVRGRVHFGLVTS